MGLRFAMGPIFSPSGIVVPGHVAVICLRINIGIREQVNHCTATRSEKVESNAFFVAGWVSISASDRVLPLGLRETAWWRT